MDRPPDRFTDLKGAARHNVRKLFHVWGFSLSINLGRMWLADVPRLPLWLWWRFGLWRPGTQTPADVKGGTFGAMASLKLWTSATYMKAAKIDQVPFNGTVTIVAYVT